MPAVCRRIENQIVQFCKQVVDFLNKGFSALSDDNFLGALSSSSISAPAADASGSEWELWRVHSTAKHKGYNLYLWFKFLLTAGWRIVSISGRLDNLPLHHCNKGVWARRPPTPTSSFLSQLSFTSVQDWEFRQTPTPKAKNNFQELLKSFTIF